MKTGPQTLNTSRNISLPTMLLWKREQFYSVFLLIPVSKATFAPEKSAHTHSQGRGELPISSYFTQAQGFCTTWVSIADFCTKLQRSAKHDAVLKDMLRDHLACGIADKRMQLRLPSEWATAMESAQRVMPRLHVGPQQGVHTITSGKIFTPWCANYVVVLAHRYKINKHGHLHGICCRVVSGSR